MIPRVLLEASMRLEFKNQDILSRNLRQARKELAPILETSRTAQELDRRMGGLLRDLEETRLNNAQAYQMGLNQGKTLTAISSGAGVGSSLDEWVPWFDPFILGQIDTRSTNLIKGLTSDLRERILREAQVSYALGEGTTQTMKRILGTGLSGLQGRDGVFKGPRFRAEAIARTTTNEFLNLGALNSYRQIIRDFPHLALKKEWVTTSDQRTSDVCLSLSGQVQEMEDLFQGRGWSGMIPPAHPFCRSRVVSVSRPYEERGRVPSRAVDETITERLKNERKAN